MPGKFSWKLPPSPDTSLAQLLTLAPIHTSANIVVR